MHLWFPAPNLKQIEPLLIEILPMAVGLEKGMIESHDQIGVYQLVLPTEAEKRLDLEGVSLITANADRAAGEVRQVGIGSKLISDFAEKTLERPLIDILRLCPLQPSRPQRITEKIARLVTFRPARVEEGSTLLSQRLWVHSVFLVGWESLDEGLEIRHFLQDGKGRFLIDPQSLLRRLDESMMGEGIEKLDCLPKSLRTEWGASLQREALLGEFAKDLESKQSEELSKALSYYETLENDLRLRLLQQSKRSLIKSLQNKLDVVRRERDSRMANIRERYQSQLLLKPVGARCFILPTYVIELKPGHANTKAVLHVQWCPVLREFLEIECPLCGEYAKTFTLHKDAYACPSCEK